MATQEDVRRIALRLPGASESPDGRGFGVAVKGKEKGFAWYWNERVHPKKPKVVNMGVLAVIVDSLTAKDIILGSDDRKFFTEPHYNGFPAVLVRIGEIEPEELEDLLTAAWRCKAPKELLLKFDADGPR